MAVSVKTYFDGQQILLPDELKGHAPGDVTIIFEEKPIESEESTIGLPLLEEMIEISKKIKGAYPEDLAENHDHYLHGRPKR